MFQLQHSNTYRHIVKGCQKPKKEKETKKCYKCNKVKHLVKDYKLGQKIKNRSVQEDSDDEDNNKQESFVRGSEQAQYNKSLYIVIPRINTLFHVNKMIKREN